MKYHYCSSCNHPFKRLFNCKYEKNVNDCFVLCANCALKCSKIFKKTFKSKSGKFVSIGLLNPGKKEVFFSPIQKNIK